VRSAHRPGAGLAGRNPLIGGTGLGQGGLFVQGDKGPEFRCGLDAAEKVLGRFDGGDFTFFGVGGPVRPR